MKALLGLLRLYLRSRKTESGVRIIGCDTGTGQSYWVSILNDGTVRVTSTGTAKLPAKSWTRRR